MAGEFRERSAKRKSSSTVGSRQSLKIPTSRVFTYSTASGCSIELDSWTVNIRPCLMSSTATHSAASCARCSPAVPILINLLIE
jgi:hypothetical protein